MYLIFHYCKKKKIIRTKVQICSMFTYSTTHLSLKTIGFSLKFTSSAGLSFFFFFTLLQKEKKRDKVNIFNMFTFEWQRWVRLRSQYSET